jgi:hypothetical protein
MFERLVTTLHTYRIQNLRGRFFGLLSSSYTILFTLLLISTSLIITILYIPEYVTAQQALLEPAIKLLVNDAINALKSGDTNKALTHMNLVDHELASVAGNSTSIQTLKLLMEDAIQSLQSGETNNSLAHLHLAYQLLSAPSSNAVIASASKVQNNVTNFLTYDNPILGLRINYPSNWLIREYSYNPAANNTVVGFFSPSKTASALGNVSGVSGSFVPYVDIFVLAPKNMSLDQMVKQTINNFLTSTSFALNESKPITLTGNQPAHMLVYTVTGAQGEFFKKMQVWTRVGGKAYVITFTSEAALYPTYLLTVQQMINSFEIRKTTATTS